MRPIVLLTDFGLKDQYVGVLHAVLVREAPGGPRIDLSHEIPAGDVWQACYLLRCAWAHLPAESVVLAVVDPGVGTDRRAVAVRIGGRFLVAPDNGLARAVGPAEEASRLDWRRMGLPEPSRTFHGRDLFAPAAARLAGGEDVDRVGDRVDIASMVPNQLPDPEKTNGGWQATVLHVDRFGNLVTNLPASYASSSAVAERTGGGTARRVETFAQGAPGEVVMLEGSSGLLELVVNGGSAAQATELIRGDIIEVKG